MLALGALILIGAVIAFILQPVIQGHWASLTREDDEMTEAEARRRVSLLALRDAEYDYETGKLDAADYQLLKRQLSAEALAAFRDVEADADMDAVEAEVAVAREEMRGGVRCSACASANPAGSRFCGSCGAALGAQEPAGSA